ncbi:MAG: lysophospholipid acyltransferase family protein [Candidatus Omnitrophica bacterium]|nr:lysophospholipid acyltransferase family protein [Candidatus Omnitrophota bacterium]
MFNYILYRIGQFIALFVPLKLAYKIAVFLSDLHYLFAKEDRRQVFNNLKVIFPEKSDREIRRIRLRMKRNFAKYLVDFFRFSKIDKKYIKRKIKIENLRYLDDALSKQKGVIALTAHLGNWELGGVVVSLLGYSLAAVALPHKDKKVDNFFNLQRKRKGIKVIPLGKAVKACLNTLKENKIVALVGDRDFTEKGIIIDFFGKPTFLPEGPAAFALKTGAIIVPGFMVRNHDDSFTLRIEKPIEPIAVSKSINYHINELKKLVTQYKIIIEDYIRKYPEQWYMFKKFWIDPISPKDAGAF